MERKDYLSFYVLGVTLYCFLFVIFLLLFMSFFGLRISNDVGIFVWGFIMGLIIISFLLGLWIIFTDMGGQNGTRN